jgi:hypothetical protein
VPDRFATIVTCIDGRIQHPLSDWAKEHLAVDYIDTITEPGPDFAIAAAREASLAALVAKIRLSQHAHGSSALVIAGHSDCAGNPVSEADHHEQLRRAVAKLALRLPRTRILAVHAGQCGHDCWQPRLVAEITARPEPKVHTPATAARSILRSDPDLPSTPAFSIRAARRFHPGHTPERNGRGVDR